MIAPDTSSASSGDRGLLFSRYREELIVATSIVYDCCACLLCSSVVLMGYTSQPTDIFFGRGRGVEAIVGDRIAGASDPSPLEPHDQTIHDVSGDIHTTRIEYAFPGRCAIDLENDGTISRLGEVNTRKISPDGT